MAPENECKHEMFVMTPWDRNGLAVPLTQIKLVHGDEQTEEAVKDWHYWINRGYVFG